MNIAAGAAAYANTAKALGGLGGAGALSDAGGIGSFSDLLKSSLQGAVDTQRQSETASLSAVTGKADIGSIVSAVNNAELTLQTVLAVRDKMVSAYTEIMHMAV